MKPLQAFVLQQVPRFTPAPWKTDEKDHDESYLDIQIKGKWIICKVLMDDAPVRDYNSEQLANARLITASPKLFNALCAMLTHMGMDEDEYNKPTFDQARQAINEALGGTNDD